MTGELSTSDHPQAGNRIWCGADQPKLRALGIEQIRVGPEQAPVGRRQHLATPFWLLSELTRMDRAPARKVLVVPPISGHFTPMLRDVILGLLPEFRVFVLDWVNVRHVSLRHGTFGFGDNIRAIRAAMRQMRGGGVLALCQAGVPALAATALLAAEGGDTAPAALTLVGAPIDPLANPTDVVRLLRGRRLSWFPTVPLWPVSSRYAGCGRMVYPASMHLAALNTYLNRRASGDTEIARKLRHDDGADPEHFPFLDLYTSIMDIDGRHYVENIERIFHARALATGHLKCDGDAVTPEAIRATALLTIEGAQDDIAAPGQTAAAHDLCPALPAQARGRLVVPACGHFSLFHGDIWRAEVLPEVRAFLLNRG